MKLINFCATVMSLLTTVNAAATCPGGFVEHANKCYKVSTDRLSWHEARFECLSLDGNYDLAIVDNLELFEFFKKYQNHWIGLYSRVGKRDFRWVDNTKMEFGKTWKKKPWGVTEPSDIGAHEDCVHTMAGGLWNDYYCGARYNYICGPASQEWCEFISDYECNDEYVKIHCPATCSTRHLYKTNLEGHWDAMSLSSLTKDGNNKVSRWSDLQMKYDVKAPAINQPKYVSNAINGFPAIDFSGTDIGLASDVKYAKGPNTPFTWIMAIKPKAGKGWDNLFSTSDGNWGVLNLQNVRTCNDYKYYPIAATIKGIHGWCVSSYSTSPLPNDKLTIQTIWYDGTTVKVYNGKDIKATQTPSDWGKGQIGYVTIGIGMQHRNHRYSGYVGEVLAYDVALESSKLNSMIDAMTEKWTTGGSWKN